MRHRNVFKREKGTELSLSTGEAWMQNMLYGAVVDTEEHLQDKKVRNRLLLMSATIVLLLGLFIARLFTMQVLSSSSYTALANGNRVREEVTYAPRGRILDVKGRELASNTLVFQLSVLPYLLEKDQAARDADFEVISSLLGEKRPELESLALAKGADFVQPLLVAENIPHQKAIALDARIGELKGFTLEEVPVRQYDASVGLAHFIGYSGRVSELDIEKSTNKELLPTDFIGKIGLEKTYDDQLRGTNGWRKIEVDALGRPVRVIASREPVQGNDLELSIDLDIQKSMYNGMVEQMKKAKSKRASGVAVDPRTGQLIAMVSIPSYDNNLFAKGISQKDYSKLANDPTQPLYDKTVGGGYTSGSIIKPIVAAAALQENVVNENTTIVDKGFIEVQGENGGSFRFNGWRLSGLGPMNARSALAWSSNIYFYTVGGGFGDIKGLGEERLTKYYRMFGLGEATGVDLPDETIGRVPDNQWKLDTTGEPWYVGDSYNISIGQGDLLISPLQITMAEATIVNNGSLLQPHFKKNSSTVVRREVAVDKKYLRVVREGMRQVLTNGASCECTFKNVPVHVAGKSGTAETNTPGGRPPHAWFTAFAPYESPEFLATVLLEEGVGGSQYAAPAIAKTMETYFQDRR